VSDFRWCIPHFDIVRPADTRPRVLLNRYPDYIIGAMVVAFGRGYGIRWKDTGQKRFWTHWRNFYAVNRGVWPDMSRRAALVDAFRASRRIRGHYDRRPESRDSGSIAGETETT
jgi:hypothetical protein